VESSTNEFPSMYVTGKGANEQRFAPAILARAGPSTLEGQAPQPVDDYSAIAVDPMNDSFWASAEYGSLGARPNGATTIANFSIQTPAQAPTITSVTPASGPPLTPITLGGTGFASVTFVAFGSLTAPFTAPSDTQINTSVPAGAIPGPDPIMIGGPGGTATIPFTVTSGSILPTKTVVTTFPNPSVVGQPVSISITVMPTVPTSLIPSGTVQITFKGVSLGSATLNAGGSTNFSVSSLPVGATPDTITVNYVGDTNFSPSGGTAAQQVNKGDTTTTVTPSIASPVVGQSVTFTANVAATPPAAGTPTGTVTFFDNGVMINSAPLDATGTATVSFPLFAPAAAHTITASYDGDPKFNGSTGAKTVTVSLDSTKTSLTLSLGSAVYGQPIVVSGIVSNLSPGSSSLGGTINLLAGGSTIATGTVNDSGRFSVTNPLFPAGITSIIAQYNGNATNQGSSATAPLLVTPAETSEILRCVPIGFGQPKFGQPVTCTAQVLQAPPSLTTPVGTASFQDGTTSLGSALLNGAGSATITIPSLSVGPHNIIAAYGGTLNFLGSSATQALTVTKANTITSLASSMNQVFAGQQVQFTAVVVAMAPGAGVPSGTVTFFDGTSPLVTLPVDKFGQATTGFDFFTVAGPHNITAVYNGDVDFNGSTSAVLTETVNVGVPKITFSIASKSRPSDEVTCLNIEIMNAGTGLAKNVVLKTVIVKTIQTIPGGTGVTTLDTKLSPSLPDNAGDIAGGSFRIEMFYFDTQPNVARFSVTFDGTFQDANGLTHDFSGGMATFK
jgi:hypothetical protein